MRKTIIATLLSCAFCAGAHAQQKSSYSRLPGFETQAISLTSSSSALQTASSLWIWADKNVYQPGEALTLRWTAKSGGDLYPYSIFCYRQNNQTGVKTYFPANTTAVTDIYGRTAAQGYTLAPVPAATKQILIGSGGAISGSAFTIPDEKGMHTFVVELRDYTGGQIVKASYFKFGVVGSFENLPATISADMRLTNDKAYRVSGIVTVTNDATLTIDPGTFIIGQPGSQPPSVLLISTAGKINASGTRSRPIIMTSSQPLGSRNRGDWGGLILLGRAVLNAPGGSLNIEGLPDLPETRYGGTDDTHNCGTLRYVRVEFAGSLLRPNEETNAFTWGACGSQTVLDHLQAHYGLDDSFEWFGGNADAKYLVGTYGADDYVDTQIGYRGRVQFALGVANDDQSNRGVETDNYEFDFGARPLGKATMYNLTFVGGGSKGYDEADAPCLYYRRGAGGITNNVICYHWVTRTLGGSNFDSIQPNIDNGDFNINGVLAWDNGYDVVPPRANTIDVQVVEGFLPFAQSAARQFVFADPLLRKPLERSDPDFRPNFGSPAWGANWVAPPDDGFFDQSAKYIGAFGDVDWTEEWTTFIQEEDLQP